MYRFLIETLLGVHLEGNRLRVDSSFSAELDQLQDSLSPPADPLSHHHQPSGADRTGANELSLDGQTLTDETIPLTDDHLEHFVELRAR